MFKGGVLSERNLPYNAFFMTSWESITQRWKTDQCWGAGRGRGQPWREGPGDGTPSSRSSPWPYESEQELEPITAPTYLKSILLYVNLNKTNHLPANCKKLVHMNRETKHAPLPAN